MPKPTPALIASSRAKITHPRRSEPEQISWNEFKLDRMGRPEQYVPNTPNRFQKMKNGQVIQDNATGLMWERNGSSKYMKYGAAQKYVKQLNWNRFAGYNDWRLPTVDELTSLLTKTMQVGGLHISSVFGKKQRWCWSSDWNSSKFVWLFRFDDVSFVFRGGFNYSTGYVRAVRSRQ